MIDVVCRCRVVSFSLFFSIFMAGIHLSTRSTPSVCCLSLHDSIDKYSTAAEAEREREEEILQLWAFVCFNCRREREQARRKRARETEKIVAECSSFTSTSKQDAGIWHRRNNCTIQQRDRWGSDSITAAGIEAEKQKREREKGTKSDACQWIRGETNPFST